LLTELSSLNKRQTNMLSPRDKHLTLYFLKM
jgi:hypothetical protein